MAYCPAATDRRNLSALVPHGFTKIPPTYLGILMKSVVAAKAVLFPEAEEKTISAAGAYWRMLSSSPRIGAVKSSSIWEASNTKITALSLVGDARRYISKNQRIVVFRLIQ